MQFVDALDRTRPDALRPRPVRGRRHRRGGRVRPHGRQACGDAAAPRARLRQRVGQSPQRHARPVRRSSTSSATTRCTTRPTTRRCRPTWRAPPPRSATSSASDRSAAEIGADGAETLAAAMSAPGRVATLIAPSDTGWDEGGVVAEPIKPQGAGRSSRARWTPRSRRSASAARRLIIAGGSVLEDAELTALLAGIARAHRVPPSSRRRPTGGSTVARPGRTSARSRSLWIWRWSCWRTLRHAILIEARQPVAFFAYPGKPSCCCRTPAAALTLADLHEDGPAAVRALADRVGAKPPVDGRRAAAGDAAGARHCRYQALGGDRGGAAGERHRVGRGRHRPVATSTTPRRVRRR